MPNRRARGLAGASLALLALGACVPRTAAPPPLPAPRAAPPPELRPAPVQPTPPPPSSDWQSGPLSPGDWRYRARGASFRSLSSSFDIMCENREIQLFIAGDPNEALSRSIPGGDTLVIVTSYGVWTLNAVLSNPGRAL